MKEEEISFQGQVSEDIKITDRFPMMWQVKRTPYPNWHIAQFSPNVNDLVTVAIQLESGKYNAYTSAV